MKGNPWVFGIVFFGTCCYLLWNNFELPTIFWGETKSTKAIVIKNQFVPGFLTGGHQMITFSFRTEDSLYTFKKKLNSRREHFEQIGSHLQIRYATSDPSHYEIEKHFKLSTEVLRLNYFWSDSTLTEELHFVNGVVFIDKRTINGELIETQTREFLFDEKNVYIMPLLYKTIDHSERSFSIVTEEGPETLLEYGTNRIFR